MRNNYNSELRDRRRTSNAQCCALATDDQDACGEPRKLCQDASDVCRLLFFRLTVRLSSLFDFSTFRILLAVLFDFSRHFEFSRFAVVLFADFRLFGFSRKIFILLPLFDFSRSVWHSPLIRAYSRSQTQLRGLGLRVFGTSAPSDQLL